ncbi:MAG: hypothetical protein V3R75_02560 [Alphaproteobacteria bacterium]
MISAVIGIVIAYVLIAVLLLSMNLTSRWKWWIKAGTIVVTTGFFVQSFASIVGIVGWPSTSALPPAFKLHWGAIVEPNQFMGEKGVIYLWVEELDDNNVPMGVPRAFELPYSDDLAEKLDQATKNIQEGMEQAGAAEALQASGGREAADEEDTDVDGDEPAGRYYPEAFIPDETVIIEFRNMPVPIMSLKTDPEHLTP